MFLTRKPHIFRTAFISGVYWFPYNTFEDKQYAFSIRTANFEEAVGNCTADGGGVATILSQQYQNFLATAIDDGGFTYTAPKIIVTLTKTDYVIRR